MSDADEFEAFVRRFQNMVYGTAVRLLGNRADAEDVAQTVFLKAFQQFDRIGRSPSAGGWLKTVTTHGCLNHLSRYRARWQFFSELDGAQGGERDFAAGLVTEGSPETILHHADQHERLERALLALPDHQRVPLVLYHFEEASYQDIAATLGVSLAKVKTDIHRGREALKRHLSSSHAPR
jgi:RNA polymerase sigma-70 factor (ECF subfamily)